MFALQHVMHANAGQKHHHEKRRDQEGVELSIDQQKRAQQDGQYDGDCQRKNAKRQKQTKRGHDVHSIFSK